MKTFGLAAIAVVAVVAPFAASASPQVGQPQPKVSTADAAAGGASKLVYLGDQARLSTWRLTAPTAIMHLADGSTRDATALTLGMDVTLIKVRFDKATLSADGKSWTYSGNVTVDWGDGRTLTSDEVALQKLFPR